jgi:radical SAM superfamily enzyme YgiQ (UPF0313 family)
MNILFVYPNVTRAVSPQIGICMLAAVAHQQGHRCDLYDLTTIPRRQWVSAFRAKLQSFDPDLLAVSCRSNEWSFIEELFHSVEVDNRLKVFGGAHATVAPEEVIRIADVVVIGEGEDTFAELLEKGARGDDTTNISGCWVKEGDRIFKNEMRNLISDVDKLPFPHWKIFDDIHFYDSYAKRHFEGAKVVGTFENSRGCPYACSYCTNDYVRTLYEGKGKWRREKSPERIVQELRLFRDEYGLDGVYWIDEVLLTGTGRLEKFRDLYVSEIGVPFCFMERPENMTDRKVEIIKQAGAKMVAVGIESGDENIRNNLLNRRHSQKTVISAFQTAKKYGISTHAFTMIGFPGETKDSIMETYELLKKAQPDTVQTTIFYPLKGTKLLEEVVNKELFDPNTPMPNNYYDVSHLNFPANKQRELLRYQNLLSFYNSKLMQFFVRANLSHTFFRIFTLSFRVWKVLRKWGFLPTIRAIGRRIT